MDIYIYQNSLNCLLRICLLSLYVDFTFQKKKLCTSFIYRLQASISSHGNPSNLALCISGQLSSFEPDLMTIAGFIVT